MATAAVPYAKPIAADLPGTAERAYVVCVLLLSTGAFMNLATKTGESADDASGSLVMQLVWISVYAGTIFLLRRYCKGWSTGFLREKWLALLIGFAFLSAFWSFAPEVTLRRGVALVCTCLFGVYLAMRFTLREQIHLLAWACGIAVLFSLVFGLLGIGHSVDQESGWIGVYVQKNALGRMMAFSLFVFLFFGNIYKDNRWIAWCGATLSALLLFLSGSKTALVVLLVLACLYPLGRLMRRSPAQAIAGGTLVMSLGCAALYWVATHLEAATDVLGRSVTLSGRLKLWIISGAMALRRPWFGYGYNAFWLGDQGPSTVVWHFISWHPPHAHNGFLQLWLDLGLIGLAILFFGSCVAFVRAIGLLRRSSSPEAFWPLVYLVFIFLYNVTEASFLMRNNIFWILYTGSVLTVSPALRSDRNLLREVSSRVYRELPIATAEARVPI